MDAGRISVLEAVWGKVGAFSAEEAIRLIEQFTTDAGRISALELLQGKVGAFSAEEAIRLIEQFTTEAGRTSALETVQKNLGRVTSKVTAPRTPETVNHDGVLSRVDTDSIHHKDLTFGPGEYRATISRDGSVSVLGSIPSHIIPQIMREATQARTFRDAYGPGRRLAQAKPNPTYGIYFKNIVGKADVQIHILAVYPLSYVTENIHIGSGSMQTIATVLNLNGRRWAEEFLEHIERTKYELIVRSSTFGDIVLEKEDAMMIWSADPISLGGISAGDRSRLYILQTTPEDAQSILDLMLSTHRPDDSAFDESSRCWVIRRKGTNSEETEHSRLCRST